MTATDFAEITQKRSNAIKRDGFKILEAHACEATGGGVVLGERNWGRSEVKAFFFKPRAHRRAFREKPITSAHERVALPGQVAKILQAEKDAKKAPHDLKVGEILSCIWGVTMQGVRFYKVVDIPNPRKVSVAIIGSEMVSGDWMSGTTTAVDKPVTKDDICGTYMVDMSSGHPSIKTGSSIERMTRWNGNPVDVYSD